MTHQAASVSIVIPAYQAGRTLEATLRSLEAQGAALRRIRSVVLADDGSTDDTREVALRWRDRLPLEVASGATNRGERRTTNLALSALHEVEWAFLLHADDTVRPTWASTLLDAIDLGGDRIGSVSASYDVVRADGRRTRGEELGFERRKIIRGGHEAAADTLRDGCWWKISSCAIRLRAFHEVGGFAPHLPQLGDWDFCIRLLRCGWDIVYVPMRLSDYHEGATSVSSHSLWTHRDVVETLQLLEVHGDLLPRLDRARRYAWLCGALGRRVGRSALERQPERLVGAARLIPETLGRALGALVSGRPVVGAGRRPT